MPKFLVSGVIEIPFSKEVEAQDTADAENVALYQMREEYNEYDQSNEAVGVYIEFSEEISDDEVSPLSELLS